MRRTRNIILTLIISLGLVALQSTAQDETPTKVTAQNRSGELPFSTSVGTEIEHVDLGSGALDVKVPLIKVPGRGLDAELYLRWNSNYLIMAPRTDGLGRPYWIWNFENDSGWQTNHTYHSSVYYTMQCSPSSLGSMNGYKSHIYTDPGGTKHPLAVQRESGQCAGPGDPTGPDLTAAGMLAAEIGSSATVTLADGSLEDYQDSNGNQENNTTPIDTLGRAFYSVQTSTDGHGNVTKNVYTYTDSNGNPQTYTVNWQLINVTTSFSVQSGGWGPVHELNSTRNVVASIVLPNTQQYVFKYNDPYGEITEIDLPTGAVITYAWATLSDTRQTRRYVSSRTENINSVQSTWQISMSVVAPFYQYSSTVTYPAAGTPSVQNQSVFATGDGAVTDAKIYAGSVAGKPLREYQVNVLTDGNPAAGETCYSDLFPPPWDGAQDVGQRVVGITTILEDGSTQSQKQFDYDTLTYTYYPRHCGDLIDDNTAVQYTTNRGNVTEIREYDWGVGAPGPLIRRIDKTYLHNSNTNYLTYNIVDKVLQDTVYDNNGNQIAQTKYEYDDTGLVSSGGAPQHDATYTTSFLYRGNVSKVNRWRNSDGQFLTTTYTYDDLGNIRAITDPAGNATNYDYTDKWSGSACPPPSNSQAYVTTITNALSQQVKRTYFQCTGLLQARQDQNDINASRAGTTYLYDFFGRTTQKSLPDNGQVSNAYNDVPPVSVTTTTKVTSSLNMVSVAIQDGLGRVTQTQLTSDPDGTTYVDTAYDALGRKSTVSNPHRSTAWSTDGTTTYGYDPLSRVTSLTEQDGSQVLTTFATNCTTVADETGRKRKSCADGLGRMTGVWEDPANLNYETDYGYDVLGNLTGATQKGGAASGSWRTRTFSYDSLSRLLSANNPESGTITYSYVNSSNGLCAGDLNAVCTKTALSPNQPSTGTATVVTTYAYDALNRVTSKSYQDSYTSNPATPIVNFGYDGVALSGCTPAPPSLTDSNPVGYRTAMCDGSGATSWNHDPLGRAITEKGLVKGTSNVTESVIYAYNLDGSLYTLTYPSGKVITYAPGGAGRPLSATASGINYLTSATYNPPGELYRFSNGASINAAETFNSRLQPLQLYFTTGAITSNTLTQLQATTCPTTAAAIMSRSYNFAAGSTDNGNVISITNCLNNNRTQNFDYDTLNRIQDAYSTGPKWGEAYTIDAWGNLTNIGSYLSKTNSEMLNAAPASTNNQLTGFTYDAAGNMTKNGTTAYTYDAENRLIWSNAGDEYIYDGDGNRTTKCTASSQANTCPSGSTGTLYWRNTAGDPIEQAMLSGTLQEEFIFFGGKRVARRDVSNNAVHYYFLDHLGSTSMVTNATGTTPWEEDLDYYPYGGIVAGSTDNVPQRYKFTGKERDSESGLDMFGARYYGSSLGRFMTPDWAAKPITVPYANFGNPQSLNLYSYVENNPLTLVDTDGHDIIYADNLKNAQVVKDSVQAILADPHTSASLSGYVGPNSPNLTIQSGDLSAGDTRTVNPDGSVTTTTVQGNTAPDIQTTSGSSTFGDVTTTSAPETTLNGATITIDNRTSKGDVPGVMVHEGVHAGEAKADPAKFSKDSAAEKSLPHDQRPQEQRANAAQKAYGPEIKQAVKQIEKDRKKDPNQ